MGKPEKRIGYYYCSLSTFQNIVKNNSIFLSDPLKMNDKSEVKWALKLFSTNPFFKDFFNTLGYEGEWGKIRSKFDYCKDYKTRICCFSKNGNLLSQWRAYADQGCGLAIGFDLDKLAGEYINLGITNIDYTGKSINSDTYRGIPLSQYTDIFLSAGCDFEEMVQELMPLFLKFKSPYFSEEKEVRLIYQEDSIICHYLVDGGATYEDGKLVEEKEPLKNDYRLWNNDAIIKYSELPFEHDAIHRIMIGPRCKLSSQEVNDMVKFYFKTDKDTIVVKSRISLQ